MQAVPLIMQAPAPSRPAYRRRYRRRRYPRRRKLSRALRTFVNARRKYPASTHAYTFQPRTEHTLAAFGPTYREATEAQKQERINARYYGRGMYTGQGSFWKKAAKTAWKHRGTILDAANMAGVPGAASLKRIAGSGMYTGQGEYESQNGLFGNETADVPTVVSSGTEDGTIKISHREYLTDLYGIHYENGIAETPMQKYIYQLNPGLETTFPWLSQLAQNFEEYELEQCIFSFRSTLQEVSSANGQVGTIVMATQYNPDTPDFRDKNEMMMYSHANSAKATDDIMHGVECDDAKLSGTEEKYIRAGPLDTGSQLKDYDHGKFTVSVNNTPEAFNDQSIGELWVSYTVCLRKPKLFTSRGLGGTQFLAIGSRDTGLPNAHANSNAMPFIQSASQLIYAKKNTLNIKVDYVGDPFSSSASAKGKLSLIFPASFAGSVKVKVKIRLEQAIDSSLKVSTPGLQGNVYALHDIMTYQLQNEDYPDADFVDNPSWYFSTVARRVATSVATGDWIYMEAHLLISPANNATDNAIYFGDNGTKRVWDGGLNPFIVTVRAVEIQVEEYNTNLLRNDFNRHDALPEFVDSNGISKPYPQ